MNRALTAGRNAKDGDLLHRQPAWAECESQRLLRPWRPLKDLGIKPQEELGRENLRHCAKAAQAHTVPRRRRLR